jgi:hypothetical protein
MESPYTSLGYWPTVVHHVKPTSAKYSDPSGATSYTVSNMESYGVVLVEAVCVYVC